MSKDPKSAFRGWRIVLGASLMLNLLCVGLVLGAVLNHRHNIRDRPAAIEELSRFGPYARALTPQDQAELRAAFLQQAGALRENRRAMRQDFVLVLELLRADPFDPAATQGVLDRQQMRVDDQARILRQVLVNHVAGMNAAERAAFADRLTEMLRYGPGHRRNDD